MEPLSCAPLGYLEILDKAGRVTQRTPVRSQILRIGRAYDNDVIVDDPYVSPYHARLVVEEGQPTLADLQSINGITDATGRLLPATVSLSEGNVVILGRTPFCFKAMDHQLAPTRVAVRNGPLQFLLKPAVLWVVFLLTLGSILLETYFGSTEEFELLKQAPILLSFLALIFIWAMLWSFASRVVMHRWNFWRFCGIACIGLLLSSLAETGIEYFCFAFAMDSALSWMNYFFGALVIGVVLYLNLRQVSAAKDKLLIRSAGIIAMILVLLAWGVQYSQQRDFYSSPVYKATLKAPFWKVRGSSTAEDFFKQGESLFDELNTEIETH